MCGFIKQTLKAEAVKASGRLCGTKNGSDLIKIECPAFYIKGSDCLWLWGGGTWGGWLHPGIYNLLQHCIKAQHDFFEWSSC